MSRPKIFPIKKLIGFDDDLWDRVREYRFTARLNTESDAVRQLIEAGLKAPRSGPTGGSQSGGESNAGADAKPATQRKPLLKRSTAPARPLSKEAQLRALREATP